ncbi:hypothetical protein [Riemerella anatipestifer]|uniref:Head decoration protein n=1 Tax=Riemerella anatipestifer TaxID=34085 RepID=A0A1S7DQF0_RIEAN|nr:hypothetical protein [Riemerella anatipestifer]AQY21343.1 hypothetical protein AB406_0384 [Riemerella anatipestifer]
MGKYLEPKKVSENRSIPVWAKVLETAKGGFALDKTGLKDGEILSAGTPIAFDEKTRIAKKAKTDGTDAKGLLYDDIVIGDKAPLSVVIRGTVYESRVTGITPQIKEKLEGNIIFSQSY